MLNLVDNRYPNEVQAIVQSLNQKSKRSFKHRQKELKEQALHFSPFYRDFIDKIIKNGSLKIVHKWDAGYIIPNGDELKTSKLSKRQKNQVCFDISNKDTLPHELGHAVDAWFGWNQALTTNVILSNGKTLKEIFSEEFESKHKEIYKEVMEEYKAIINSNINDKAYDLLTSNMLTYKALLSVPINKKDEIQTAVRQKFQQQLYNIGFVETYYQLIDKKCFDILNRKYSPILDALSSKYDFCGLCLHAHPLSYYGASDNNDVYEFFANLFAAKVTSKYVQFDSLIKFLPKSFEAFEELFSIVYTHIQNNKRFTDIKTRKDINHDELQ